MRAIASKGVADDAQYPEIFVCICSAFAQRDDVIDVALSQAERGLAALTGFTVTLPYSLAG
jgi:hypothetical protein